MSASVLYDAAPGNGHSPPEKQRCLQYVASTTNFRGAVYCPPLTRQPLTGPHLPPPEAVKTTQKEKPPCPQGTEPTSQRTSLALFPQGVPTAQALPRRQPKLNKRKAPAPAGHKSSLSKDKPAIFSMKIPLRKYRCHYAPFSNSDMRFLRLPCSQRDTSQLSFRTKPYAGIARRGGRSPSAARKLTKQMLRSPRGMAETGKPLEASPWERKYTTSPAGSSGGSAEGASEGRQPLTGPHLPPAAQAAQIKIKKGSRARRAQNPPLKGQVRLYSS